MSSTILYKFRSGTNFETLPLPGTSARLIDIKRAIVKAKKLDRNTTTGSLDFDFAIQNANTNEEYGDDTMILPRGTRIIVRRVATERNMGLLHRMAMGNGGNANIAPSSAVRSDFYTIRSHDRVEEDEFVDQDAPQAASAVVDESAELEALKAVTDQAASVYGSSSGASSGGPGGPNKSNYVAGGGGPNGGGRGGGGPPQFGKPPPHNMQQQQPRPPRPNADPELRQQELPKKKTTTGIPRTFLSLSAPAPTPAEGDNTEEEDAEGGAGGGGLASQLNPNQHVFQALINRAGGQSIGGEAGKRRDLDYALKLTATSIPEHLQCGICHSVVKSAMLVPWDSEGRPTCESCIRDALAQNGFKCPLTGTEGVSPDDLFPNVGLRKAAELFVEDIMQQMDQIEKQLEAEEAEEEKRNALAKEKEDRNVFEGDAGEGGTLLTRKAAKAGSGKKGYEDDLFGGGDDFGGDVFDVAEDDVEGEDDNMTDEPVTNESDAPKSSGDKVDDNNNTKTETTDATVSSATDPIEPSSNEKKSEEDVGATKKEGGPGTATNGEGSEHNSEPADSSREQHEKNDSSHNLSNNTASTSNRRRNEAPKRRGPPAGYMLGPAGVSGPSLNKFPPPNNNVPPPPPPRGPPMMGRGSGMNDRGPPGGNYPDNHYGGGRGGRGHQNFGRGNNDWNRKRDFNQMDGGGMHQEMNQGGWGGAQRDNYGGRGNPNYQGGGRGNPHYQGGGRGRFDYDGGRGDGYRGGRGGGRGRGNFRGGRGNYRGRGRW